MAAIVTSKSYEIHVLGQLPDDVLRELGGLRVSVERPQTVLRGHVRDQAHCMASCSGSSASASS
jgi:hypothetical protein